MKILFCKGKLPFSKAICWALKEGVSHVAIEFDNKFIIHSDLIGLHLSWANTFYTSHEIKFVKEYDLTLRQEESIYQELLDLYDGSPYDYGAFAYWIYAVFMHRLFNKPMPTRNKLESKGMFLCTKVAELVLRLASKDIPSLKKILDKKVDFEMISPFKTALLIGAEPVEVQ